MGVKDKVIAEAYGNNWIYMSSFPYARKQAFDNDGWIFVTYLPTIIDNDFFDFKQNGAICRPKSLKGIEDNNGWTKIDAHSVLPKNGTECWVKTKLSDAIFCAVYWNESFISGDVVFRLSEATYFQIVEKPKPPIY